MATIAQSGRRSNVNGCILVVVTLIFVLIIGVFLFSNTTNGTSTPPPCPDSQNVASRVDFEDVAYRFKPGTFRLWQVGESKTYQGIIIDRFNERNMVILLKDVTFRSDGTISASILQPRKELLAIAKESWYDSRLTLNELINNLFLNDHQHVYTDIFANTDDFLDIAEVTITLPCHAQIFDSLE